MQQDTKSNPEVIAARPYRNGKIRFFQLFLVSVVVFGNQYAFNNPQALQDPLITELDINEAQFNMFYTIFAFPNIFATFFIGFLIDFLGVRIGIIALSSGVAIFQGVVAIGGYLYSYYTILVGRALFGIASESLITAQACMVSIWFGGKQLAFALGIAITFPELGNALNSAVTPLIYQSTQSLGTPFLVSVILNLVCVCCAVAAAYLDKKAELADIENNIVINSESENAEQESQQIKCSDLKKLKGSFWLIVVLCMFAVAEYVPFMDNVNRMFSKRFCLTDVQAGRYIMVTYIVAASASAPLGILVDKVGFKRYFIMAGMGIFIIAQGIILAWPSCKNGIQELGPVWGLVFIGVGYCFYANCIVPSIPLVVKKKVLGTAFGIMQMIESICLAFVPLIAGVIVESQEDPQIGYRFSQLFFTLLGVVGLVTSMGLLYVSDKTKKKLDAASKPKKILHPDLMITGDVKSAPSQGQLDEPSHSPTSSSSDEGQDSSMKQNLIDKNQRFTLEL